LKRGFFRLVHQFAFILFATLGVVFDEDTPAAAPWQRPGVCGVNAVFFLLRCNGVDSGRIDHQDVLSSTTFSPDAGASINALRDSLARFGMPCENLKASPRTALREFSPPYIAHWDDTQYGGKGHFVVVLSVDDKTVQIVDCGPCTVASIPVSQFINLSSGYFIVPLSNLRRPSTLKWCLFGVGLACALFSIFYLTQK
jgi:hypothetical protein